MSIYAQRITNDPDFPIQSSTPTNYQISRQIDDGQLLIWDKAKELFVGINIDELLPKRMYLRNKAREYYNES